MITVLRTRSPLLPGTQLRDGLMDLRRRLLVPSSALCAALQFRVDVLHRLIHGIYNVAALLVRQPVKPDAVQLVQVSERIHSARLEVWRDCLGGELYSLIEHFPGPRSAYRLD